jgi:hypothetical protein
MIIPLALNPRLLADAQRLAKQSAMSTETYLRELVEAELAARRIPPAAGEPRLSGSAGAVPAPYKLHL